MLITITNYDVITADRLAQLREFYEYRRSGNNYNYNGTSLHQRFNRQYAIELYSKSNIFFGILFEICLYRAITDALVSLVYNENEYIQITDIIKKQTYVSERMRAMRISYDLTIGRFDEGYDFQLLTNNQKLRIDAKLYGTKVLNSISDCNNLSLIVDENQFNANKADLYIQGFMVQSNTNLINFYVAGYTYKNRLQHYNSENSRYTNSCFGISTSNLTPMSKLIESIYKRETIE